MEGKEGSSRPRWVSAIAGALVLTGLLAALSTAVISGFAGGAQPQDVIRRTSTPTNTHTPPPPTNTPTITNTPTVTNTPTNTLTPTDTPTPFPTKNRADLFDTVMIGGSTGGDFLKTCCTSYVPMFDGGVSGFFNEVGHVSLPGAITHLSVKLDTFVLPGDAFVFTVAVNGAKSVVTCTIPAKGKSDFCQDGNKDNDCVEVGPQDPIAIQVLPKGAFPGGQAAGNHSLFKMSWVAKLDLYGSCPG